MSATHVPLHTSDGVEFANTDVDIVADAVQVFIVAIPPHRQPHRAGFRRSRNRLQGCQHNRTRKSRQDRCKFRTRRTAHAIVDVVAHAVGICIRCAVTAAHAQGVELVAVAVAVSFGMSEHPHS